MKVPRVKCGSEETRNHQPETGSGNANNGEEERVIEHVVSCQETLRGTGDCQVKFYCYTLQLTHHCQCVHQGN